MLSRPFHSYSAQWYACFDALHSSYMADPSLRPLTDEPMEQTAVII
jgi:hypothetical protein